MNRKILAIFKLDGNTSSGTLLLQSGTDITNWGNYYKVVLNSIKLKKLKNVSFHEVTMRDPVTLQLPTTSLKLEETSITSKLKEKIFSIFFSVISLENLTCKSQRVTRECRFTLKLVRDMIITHSQTEVI